MAETRTKDDTPSLEAGDDVIISIKGKIIRLGRAMGWAYLAVVAGGLCGIFWGVWRIGTALLRLCDIAEVK